jgi:hypothetical protein
MIGTAGSGNPERSMAIDPLGHFFCDGWGAGEAISGFPVQAASGPAAVSP